jgi:hypothetical protein
MTMARWTLGALPALALLMLASPAAAQFGSIFGPPPRPPGDVPQPEYSTDPRLPPRPRFERRDDLPEPPPPPLTRLPPPAGTPQGVPPPGGVQRQTLPPPPGGSAAPPPGAQEQATRPPAAGPGQPPLPGLPPGQRQPRGTPGQALPAPNDEVVVAPPKQRIVNQTAVFSGLDKITGRIISFDVTIDETVQFGALRLTPRACYTRPPSEMPNTDGFIEVDEITLQGEVKRIFTGWMFAASPGLHGIEHPIYDVWLTDCKSDNPQVVSTEPTPAAAQPAPPAPPVPAPRPNPGAQPRR